jgi:hypothetical protein
LSKYISGKEILENYGMKPIELFALIAGDDLSPYDKFGEPIPPPDVGYYLKEISQCEQQILKTKRVLEGIKKFLSRKKESVSDKEQEKDLQETYFNMLRPNRRYSYTADWSQKEKVIQMLAITCKKELGLLNNNLALCRERNPKKDPFSWQNFEFKSIPKDMFFGSNYNKTRNDVLDHVAGNETLYVQAEVEKILNNVTKSNGQKSKILRPSQRHKSECRKAAKQIWNQNHEITIVDMILRDEIANACEGKVYHVSTLRKWVKDLCPNRSPGRRKKN